ncbi:methyltransferase family protein [Nitratireductor indicus]|uniref:methyltransferase family protein n=1 Tax=Nitratireductor indicus TaxID=721133 RepID=UPI0028765706|nr:isoprenylcysteine carboxylmethyltransferase family protein [Nitratireductor indicus]MDS1137027.1 isoprenylcysteine carboxylmethyltransferase family protein [Nitratireductor indicus]
MQIYQIALGQFQRLRIASFWIIAVILCSFVLFTRAGWEHFRPFGFNVEEAIELFGLGLIGIAILGRLWCTLYIGGRKSSELVQDGPYSMTRNPLYFFSSVGAAGVGAQTGSLVMALASAVITVFILSVTMRREALFLRGEFGANYDAYAARVPAFLPKPSLFRDPETLIVLPKRLYRTLSDGLVFFLAMPAFEFVEYLQEHAMLPILFRMY